MTAHDDTERAHDRATATVARILRGRLAAGIDADLVARHVINDLVDDGWRPIPRPPDITTARTGDPPNTAWRTARARIDKAHQEDR